MSNLPAIFDALPDDTDALSAGLTGGFAVLSIRSNRFRIKYQGVEQVVKDANGNPVPALELFIVKASPAIAKVFYKDGYYDGADEPPDCFSNDGVAPDPTVANPVCDSCVRCPKNVFGSRITDAGTKVKACSDTRRLAVVPANDIKNETFGGPMLLRVPAASLGNLADYGRKLQQRGLKYAAVVTQVSFDVEASYPKLVFKPVRIAREDEVPLIVEQVRDPTTDLICHTASTEEYGDRSQPQRTQAPQPPPQLEQIPAQTIPQVQQAAPQAQPVAPQPAQQPAPEAQQADPFDQLLQQPAVPQTALTPPTPAPAPPKRQAKAKQQAAEPAQEPQTEVPEDPSGDALEADVRKLLASLDA